MAKMPGGKIPGGKQVRWTPEEAERYEEIKAEAIEARISGDMPTTIAKAKEMHDMLQEVRKRKQMRAGRKKCKPKRCVARVIVSPKEKYVKLGEDLVKRSTEFIGA